MKVLSGHDFIKPIDKKNFLLLVSEEELKVVEEILDTKEKGCISSLKPLIAGASTVHEKRKGQRRSSKTGRRGDFNDNRKKDRRRVKPPEFIGRRAYSHSSGFKDRRSS